MLVSSEPRTTLQLTLREGFADGSQLQLPTTLRLANVQQSSDRHIALANARAGMGRWFVIISVPEGSRSETARDGLHAVRAEQLTHY